MTPPRMWAAALVVALVAAGNLAAWYATFGRSRTGPLPRIQCVSWEAHRSIDFDPREDWPLDLDEVETDFAFLAGHGIGCVRLYRVDGDRAQVPAIAARHGLEVVAGAYLTGDRRTDRAEVEALIRVARENSNVTRVIVGNEAVLRRNMTSGLGSYESTPEHDDLLAYIDEVRQAVEQPVSTSEPVDVWLGHPELARRVDYLSVHVLPYWYDKGPVAGVRFAFDELDRLHERYPMKPVFVGEVGWPTAGPQRGDAHPSVHSQLRFLRRFVRRAEKHNLDYNVIDAFDQPWKVRAHEGWVGAHWGIFTANRHDKSPDRNPIWSGHNWLGWALLSTVLGVMGSVGFLRFEPRLRLPGQLFGAALMMGLATFAALVGWTVAREYLVLFWGAWIVAIALLILGAVMVAQGIETAEVIGQRPLDRQRADRGRGLQETPFVSIHLPCRNEPPDMVLESVRHLLAMDYPGTFEVLVIDNNTTDPAIWEPLRDGVEALGDERVRFFHLEDHPGFKAGALNFALRETNPKATIIGVIDADYHVEPHWLRRAIPVFSGPRVGVVQGPQAYRDCDGHPFLRLIRDEYEGFFRIGMVQRNEDDAIIQHGTMTLMRRDVLDQVGAWAEWCITEDAELGLRILAAGYEARYIDEVLGRGLVPPDFEAYAKQRFRWAYGAVRILRRHWRVLLGREGQLTRRQRFHFVMGWMPWIGEALHPLFVGTAFVIGVLLLINPRFYPPREFAYPLLVYAIYRVLVVLVTYWRRVDVSAWRTLRTPLAGAALTDVVGIAVWTGLFTDKLAFQRTPKQAEQGRGRTTLSWLWFKLRLDSAAALLLCAIAALMSWAYGLHTDAITWACVLIVLAVPGLSSLAMSALSLGYRLRTR